MDVLKSEIINKSLSPETPERLLEAAGEVFAEKGFRNATIRDICKRAGANIAAVNYHFGDKEHLYIEVIKYAHRTLVKYQTDLGLDDNASAEERLKAFIMSFLLRIHEDGSPAWHGKLMLRELTEPTRALDTFVEDTIRPQFNLLNSIVKEVIGNEATIQEVRASSFSIIGQCLFYFHAMPVINRLVPQQKFKVKDIERLAEHISRFSLTALRNRDEGEEKYR
ncbi:MAG: CerR family C-terminal domain-containing protein [Nitrospinae bacterium]|nr:CerR family C-terminal domain-containing protein [Nitrospinota bacterium]